MYLNVSNLDLDVAFTTSPASSNKNKSNSSTLNNNNNNNSHSLVPHYQLRSVPRRNNSNVNSHLNMPSFKHNMGNNRALFAQQQPKPVRFEHRTPKHKKTSKGSTSDRLGIVPRERKI